MSAQAWDLVGGDPTPGDPDAFDTLARTFSTTASNAGDARTTLDRLAGGVDDSVWRGEAAGAFREKIGELPPQLQKLHDSYKTASEATATYSKTLRHLQTRAPALASQAQAAHNDEATWQHTRDQAVAQDPAASTATYDQAITNARTQLRQAQTNVSHLRDERTTAESALVGKLGDAHEQGIKNDFWGGLKDFLSDLGDFLLELGEALVIVAVAVLAVVAIVAGVVMIVAGLAAVAGGLVVTSTGVLAWAGGPAAAAGAWEALAGVGVFAAGIALAGQLPGMITHMSKGGKQRKRDSGLEGLSDEEISRRARDPSLSNEERRRYQREEKARGQRNKKKRGGK